MFFENYDDLLTEVNVNFEKGLRDTERHSEIISVSTPYYVTSLVYELETIRFMLTSSVCLVLMIGNLFDLMGPLRIVCQISKQSVWMSCLRIQR